MTGRSPSTDRPGRDNGYMHIVHVTSFLTAASVLPSSAVRSRGLAYRAAGHEFSVIIPGNDATVSWTEYGTVVTVPSRGRALSRGLVAVAKRIRHALEKLAPDQIEVADRLSAYELGTWARQNRVPAIRIVESTAGEPSSNDNPRGFDRVVRASPSTPEVAALSTLFGTSSTGIDDATRTSRSVLQPLLLPTGVNLEIFTPLRHNSSLRDSSDADVVIVCATPLTSSGAPSVAIEIVRRRTAAGENVHLLVVGDGPLEGRLKRSARGLPVQFLSARDLELTERAELLATADMTLVTIGNAEGHAVALESLAAGTPIVVTDTCTPSIDLIDGGGLFATTEFVDIERAMRTIACTPVENRRTAARATAIPYDSAASEQVLLALHERLYAAGAEGCSTEPPRK